jgi:predicted ester cyclase/uncharacterized protein (DUF1330 family)
MSGYDRHAQRAYSITEVEVLDDEAAQRYAELTGPAVAKYGGRFLAVGADPIVVEGEAPEQQSIVVIEWPSLAQLEAWYAGPEYAPARTIAASALRRRLRFFDGVPDASEALVRRFYAGLGSGDTGAAEEIVSPDWQDVPLAPGVDRGPQGYRQTVGFLRGAFPDLEMTIEDLVVGGDRVAVRSTARGTHEGEILGVAPTGRRVAFRAFDFHRIEDGRIAQSWHLEDFDALLAQLREGASVS